MTTSLTLLLAGVSQTGCPGGGGESCGPGDAPATGLVAAGDQVTLTYGNLEGGLNNDCPDPAAPEGVVSMTINTPMRGDGILTLCVERPDRLANEDLALGLTSAGSDVRVVDVAGASNNCTFSLDRTRPPTGTASAEGLCKNGTTADGFAFVIDGALSLERTCGATVDTVAVTLRGRVAVTQ